MSSRTQALYDGAPEIQCAQCRRAVEETLVRHDGFRDIYTIVVRCHGAEESVVLTRETIEDCKSIGFGEAFKVKALAAIGNGG